MTQIDFKTLAADAINRGFAVIPLLPAKKDPDFTLVPRVNNEPGTGGAVRRTRDLAIIDVWAQVSPNANVGVCSDEIVTILESDDEAQFRQLVRNVSRQMFGEPRELPETLTSQARPNRPHFFFLATDKTRSIEGAPGIQGLFEWRRENQYVVGPGSLHPTGVVYRVIRDVPMVAMPDWLVDVLLEIRTAYRGENSAISNYVRVGPAAIARDKLINEYALDPKLMLEDAEFELSVPAGERHYFLQAMAGLLHDGERDEDELFDVLRDMRDRYCEEGKGDYEIHNLVQWTLRRKPCQVEPNLPVYVKGGMIFKSKEAMDAAPDPVVLDSSDLVVPRYPPIVQKDKDKFDFVLEPLPGQTYGWFPRGTVSAIAGSSGTGKSTFAFDMLRKQQKHEYLLGHRGAGRRWLVMFADRGDISNRMTLQRMGINRNEVNIDYIGSEKDDLAAKAIWEAVEKFEQHELPEVVFIEGADLVVSDNNDGRVVANFTKHLQRLATHYYISVIVSLGAPKASKNQGPSARRDMLIGSTNWGRTIETTCVLTFEGDGTSTRRKFTAQHRNDATETFDMEFKNGLLVEAAPANDSDPVSQWLLGQDEPYQRADAHKALKDHKNKANVNKDIKRLIDEGKLVEELSGKKILLRRKDQQ